MARMRAFDFEKIHIGALFIGTATSGDPVSLN
jgi:hypothetical protein